MICPVCNKEFNTQRGFLNHITRTHKVSSKEAYDMVNEKLLCKFCGEEMNLINGFAFLILALIFKYWIEEQFFWYCLIIANVYFASVGNK